jgi:hypothetical protein
MKHTAAVKAGLGILGVLFAGVVIVGLLAGDSVPTRDVESEGHADYLRDIVTSAGEPCAAVDRTFRQGSRRGEHFWNVTCRGGRSYAIQITPDGKTRVLDCSVLEAVTKATCFESF